MQRHDFTLAVDGETLACDHLGPASDNGSDSAPLLMLHGAGQSNRQRQWPLRQYLAELGQASVACDFSGHGDSSACHPNSLEKRLREAQALLTHSDRQHQPRTVVGVSMGGEIALRLACQPGNRISHVVTMVGAIYDGAAFSLPFGPDFSTALRRPDSWRDASVLQLIAAYSGHITLIRAADDQVIPAEVAELVRAHARQARSCRIIDLQGVDHRLSERTAQDPVLCAQLAQLVLHPRQ